MTNPLIQRNEKNVEEMAEQLHEWYILATAQLSPKSFNPNAQKIYAELTEEQKDIDRYIAEKVLERIAESDKAGAKAEKERVEEKSK